MRHNFDRSFELLIGHEGGFQADSRDRGNWTTGIVGKGENRGTKFGITAMTYPTLDIKSLTVADAKAIYERDFWVAVRADELPDGVDYLAFDAAVNHGPKQAIRFLQIAAGAPVDGDFGPGTLAAVKRRDPLRLIEEFGAQRQMFWTRIKTWKHYGLGWTRRGYESVVRALIINRGALDESKGDPTPEAEKVWEASPNGNLLSGLFRRVSS